MDGANTDGNSRVPVLSNWWVHGVGRKPQPGLGPALGKHASLFPDSRCLTSVCGRAGQGWPPHCQGRPQDSPRQASEAATLQGGPGRTPQSSLNGSEKGWEGRKTLGVGRAPGTGAGIGLSCGHKRNQETVAGLCPRSLSCLRYCFLSCTLKGHVWFVYFTQGLTL